MEPRFLGLSAEILVEILANLQLRDIVACKLTCRTLRDVIEHSSLIQYIIQAFLAGIHDNWILGASTAERSKALRCLENAWHDLDVRKRTAHITRGTAWPWLNYVIHDDHLLAIRGDNDNPAQPPGYSYIDLRLLPPLTDLLWRRVDVAWHDQRCIFAFARKKATFPSFCARAEAISRVDVHCLSFVSGDPHPLARSPNVIVDFPATSSPHHLHVQITGDYIFISCNGSPDDESQVDVLFLVNWKQGNVTSLRESPPSAMTFAVGFMRISESLFAFVHTGENAIFLYSFLEEPPCRLDLIRVLGLPPLCDGGRLNFAECLSEQNPIFTPKYPSNVRAPPRFPFRYNPADGIASFVLGVGLEEIPDASITIAIIVHRRALATTPGTNEQTLVVPWDSWGPSATRCLEVPYWRRCNGPVGQRWAILAHDELVLRNFNPHSHENGNRTRVVTAPTLLTAGLCFRGDVMTHLPYVETRAVCTSTPRWESVLTDGERLLGVYFKEDDADPHKVEVDIYVMCPPF
ncbi:hypothetical protein BGW80DRAFT_1280034 [Lactifluus volemus]|nr:hypothetical protein BGW80DRAFT_1280034 [Lactifluus volemus]